MIIKPTRQIRGTGLPDKHDYEKEALLQLKEGLPSERYTKMSVTEKRN